jgi:hypothetical protein
MSTKENIKSKINNLLAKTTENGASKHEALSALAKAQELMTKYFITESELIDKSTAKQPILKSCDLYKCGYDTGAFYASLARLFDCKTYYNNSQIFFFGFEEDVDLCLYFYVMIIESCLKEKRIYRKKSEEYQILKKQYNGRTLSAAFVKGFLIEVSQKMKGLYDDRESEFAKNIKHGLILVDKKEAVKNGFGELGLKLKTVSSKQNIANDAAFASGRTTGKNFELTLGVKAKRTNTLTIK